jgi:predicted 3-demethylubiquinone-9 3-methyltransferase (glyoxalase superfamily)
MAAKITHCLWFDGQAEEAAKFYTKIFNGKLGKIAHYPDVGQDTHGREAGSVMTVEFEILGEPYLALNGGPFFKFNEAFSIMVLCDTQDEIDRYWKALTEGGEEIQCGWLKDRYGMSWQVCPRIMGELMTDKDTKKVGRVMAAFMEMKKFDLAAIKRAYEGK